MGGLSESAYSADAFAARAGKLADIFISYSAQHRDLTRGLAAAEITSALDNAKAASSSGPRNGHPAGIAAPRQAPVLRR
jgi:hypothetical protein